MCEFCRSYQVYQQIDEIDKMHGEPLIKEYTVALVRRAYLKGHKRQAGRGTDYRRQGLGYKLNFCPECGRRLKE